jgi:hypothetical protein
VARRLPALLALAAVAAVAAVAASATATAEERLGPIPPSQMTATQKKAVEEFTKARPDGPFGFWWGYLRVPEVMIPFLQIQTHIHEVMETEQGALGEKLTHFAMLIVAREWTQQVIWDLHDKNAIESGLEPEVLNAARCRHTAAVEAVAALRPCARAAQPSKAPTTSVMKETGLTEVKRGMSSTTRW